MLTDREIYIVGETATCLWEEVLRILNKPDHPNWGKVNDVREGEGMASFRLNVITEWVEACHNDYEALPQDEKDRQAFDWDFVPDWVDKRIAGWGDNPTSI